MSNEDRIEELEHEIDNLNDEICNLENQLEEVSEKYDNCPHDIPEELSDLLNHNSKFDVGVVMELEEVIKEVLKKHGYQSII